MTSRQSPTARDPDAAEAAPVAEALERAERAGFRLMLLGRSALLALMTLWTLHIAWISGNPVGPIATASSLLVGLVALRPLGTAHERRWHRYAIVGFDAATLAVGAITVPLLASGEVPQVFVYRAQGGEVLWFLPVVSALALSPGLTLFAGAAAAAAVWAIFLGVTAEMEQVLGWGDLPREATAAEYMALLLDPAFAGQGSRFQESAGLLAGGAILALAVWRARRVVAAHSVELARRQRVEQLFGRHVPETIARRLIEQPGDFAPSVQEATALHLDAAGFTAFAAGKPPAEVMRALDRLLGQVSAIVAREGGVVVSFGGDSVLATFGVPVAQADHADRAVAAARAVLAETRDGPLRVRIGVASGQIATGIIGTDGRQAFTVYGETVNLSQRLEQANKALGGWLLVGEAAYARLSDPAGLVEVPPLELPGVEGRCVAYADDRDQGSGINFSDR